LKLQHMADNNSNHSPTQFSRIRRNPKGTYEKTTPGSTINKGAS
jgi:hypothetical protein